MMIKSLSYFLLLFLSIGYASIAAANHIDQSCLQQCSQKVHQSCNNHCKFNTLISYKGLGVEQQGRLASNNCQSSCRQKEIQPCQRKCYHQQYADDLFPSK